MRSHAMYDISIILCTYNGAKYIEDQLDSIANQTILPSELISCDDISTDNTVSIIKAWSIHYKGKVILRKNETRLGVIKNFEQGMCLASGDYIMFCDQDDVWLPNKIEVTLRKMQELERQYGKNHPCLVHTDLRVVDENLAIIADSFLENQGLHHVEDATAQVKNLLAQNFVTGCTVMINRSLCQLAIPFPPHVIMHDYWLALVAALGGTLAFVDKPTILYRQHGDNSVGARKYISCASLVRVLNWSQLMQGVRGILAQGMELLTFKGGLLLGKHQYVRDFFDNLAHGRICQTLTFGTRKQGFIRNFIYYFALLSILIERKRFI